MKRITAIVLAAFLLTTLAATRARAQVANINCTVEKESQTLSVSGNTLTFQDGCGTQSDTFELVVSGTPATLACSLNGLMRGGTSSGTLASTTSTTGGILVGYGGPFDKWQITCTWTGGTSPTVTANRTATTARQGGVSPAWLGPTQPQPAAPIAVTGSQRIPTIAAAMAWLNTLGVTNSGVIYSEVAEDVTSQIFATGNWSGTIYLNSGFTSGNTCGQTAVNGVWNCYTTELPLIITTRMNMIGQGGIAGSGTMSQGTVFTFGSSFPAALGAPTYATAPACSSAGSGFTFYVQVGLVRNAMGGANTPQTPLWGAPTAEVALTCNTPGFTFTLSAVPGARDGNFGAYDVAVFTSTVSGMEVENGSGVARGSNPAAAVDLTGGAVGVTSGAQSVITVSSIEYPGEDQDKSAPLADTSNPMLVYERGQFAQNAFDIQVQHMTLEGSPNRGTNNSTPETNEPHVALWNATGEENSGARDVGMMGAFQEAMIYTENGNTAWYGINNGSASGPVSGNFHTFICDGRSGKGCARIIQDSTLAGRCALCSGVTVVTNPQLWIVGPSAIPTINGIHIESSANNGTDGILCDYGCNAVFNGVSGTSGGSPGALLHIGPNLPTMGNVTAHDINDGDHYNCVKDDRVGVTILTGTVCSYQGDNQFFGPGMVASGGTAHFPGSLLQQTGGNAAAVTATTCCTLWKTFTLPIVSQAETYSGECHLPYQTANATTALSLGLQAPVGSTNLFGGAEIDTNNSGTFTKGSGSTAAATWLTVLAGGTSSAGSTTFDASLWFTLEVLGSIEEVTTSGTTVTRYAGPNFQTTWSAGTPVTINGQSCTIASVAGNNTLTLNAGNGCSWSYGNQVPFSVQQTLNVGSSVTGTSPSATFQRGGRCYLM
jgi:hypothetical protein